MPAASTVPPLTLSSHPPLIDQLLRRTPLVPVTQILIAANLLIFVLMLGYGAGLLHTSNSVQLTWGANFGPATKDGEWWRLGSALFLHFGLLHLAMNMLSLWDGGRLVERMYGSGRFLLIYFCSGLSGNLLSLIAQGDQAVSGGASGAIFGVYGALMVFLWRERSRLHPSEFKRLFWGAIGFSIVTIALGLQVTGIDNAAHIGGLLAGILAGAALPRPEASASAGRSRWLAAGGLTLSLALLIANIPAPRYRWSEEVLARGEISEFLGVDARISARWDAILGSARDKNATFDALAGRIESEVSSPYAQSFEQLAKLHLSAAAPSAAALEKLRTYAEVRRDASRALVQGLRAKDPERIREALELAKTPQLAGKKNSATSPSP
ncbi:MAG: rhomboid family intramembrane serine protease [Pseudomonadota bacterium]|nr:rhomboid family intramembrane serine protease [Pseudomonadota bacterium]